MGALQVEACRTQLGPGSLVQCTVDLQERLLAAADQQVWSVSPARMRDRFVQAAPAFAGCLQQDAHEFFLEYVNQLDEEIKRQRRLQLQEQVQEGNVRRRDTDESDAPLHFDAEVTKHLILWHAWGPVPDAGSSVFQRFLAGFLPGGRPHCGAHAHRVLRGRGGGRHVREVRRGRRGAPEAPDQATTRAGTASQALPLLHFHRTLQRGVPIPRCYLCFLLFPFGIHDKAATRSSRRASRFRRSWTWPHTRRSRSPEPAALSAHGRRSTTCRRRWRTTARLPAQVIMFATPAMAQESGTCTTIPLYRSFARTPCRGWGATPTSSSTAGGRARTGRRRHPTLSASPSAVEHDGATSSI
ncbi:unnamed protein product [Prorocentrum cordatum]|uniref:Peptidase C19 ubiquitin carboxyl-terminal hydrolase domain-containing protein n=1 Tax=Prorocentrum cordatum TaxID=2364126 RepID=A0ABN9W578_9DINO|nr:unnamed protein product [Polarella glacialis]